MIVNRNCLAFTNFNKVNDLLSEKEKFFKRLDRVLGI